MTPVIERFLSKINVVESGCWEWTDSLTTKGYGQIRIKDKKQHVHRFIYEYYYGELNSTLVINHLCRNRKCCNPLHLEQVTNKENILKGEGICAVNARKTYCKRNHPLTPQNTYNYPNRRHCITCTQERNRITRSHLKIR